MQSEDESKYSTDEEEISSTETEMDEEPPITLDTLSRPAGDFPPAVMQHGDLPDFLLPGGDQEYESMQCYGGIPISSMRWEGEIYPPSVYGERGVPGGSRFLLYGPPYENPLERLVYDPEQATSLKQTAERCHHYHATVPKKNSDSSDDGNSSATVRKKNSDSSDDGKIKEAQIKHDGEVAFDTFLLLNPKLAKQIDPETRAHLRAGMNKPEMIVLEHIQSECVKEPEQVQSDECVKEPEQVQSDEYVKETEHIQSECVKETEHIQSDVCVKEPEHVLSEFMRDVLQAFDVSQDVQQAFDVPQAMDVQESVPVSGQRKRKASGSEMLVTTPLSPPNTPPTPPPRKTKPQASFLEGMMAEREPRPSVETRPAASKTFDNFLGSLLAGTKSNQPLPKFMQSFDEEEEEEPVVEPPRPKLKPIVETPKFVSSTQAQIQLRYYRRKEIERRAKMRAEREEARKEAEQEGRVEEKMEEIQPDWFTEDKQLMNVVNGLVLRLQREANARSNPNLVPYPQLQRFDPQYPRPHPPSGQDPRSQPPFGQDPRTLPPPPPPPPRTQPPFVQDPRSQPPFGQDPRSQPPFVQDPRTQPPFVQDPRTLPPPPPPPPRTQPPFGQDPRTQPPFGKDPR